jgi:hypothetical protein
MTLKNNYRKRVSRRKVSRRRVSRRRNSRRRNSRKNSRRRNSRRRNSRRRSSRRANYRKKGASTYVHRADGATVSTYARGYTAPWKAAIDKDWGGALSASEISAVKLRCRKGLKLKKMGKKGCTTTHGCKWDEKGKVCIPNFVDSLKTVDTEEDPWKDAGLKPEGGGDAAF